MQRYLVASIAAPVLIESDFWVDAISVAVGAVEYFGGLIVTDILGWRLISGYLR
jgi:hypothetical protein